MILTLPFNSSALHLVSGCRDYELDGPFTVTLPTLRAAGLIKQEIKRSRAIGFVCSGFELPGVRHLWEGSRLGVHESRHRRGIRRAPHLRARVKTGTGFPGTSAARGASNSREMPPQHQSASSAAGATGDTELARRIAQHDQNAFGLT